MDQQTFEKAQALQQKINRLERDLEKLTSPGNTLECLKLTGKGRGLTLFKEPDNEPLRELLTDAMATAIQQEIAALQQMFKSL